MGFRSSFLSPIQKGFSAEGATVSPWWLSGGISPSDCAVAYQPKGASSLVASYTNLVTPGTYNASPGVAPTWNTMDGWIGNGSAWLTTGYALSSLQSTMLVRFSNKTLGGFDCFFGMTNGGGFLGVFDYGTALGIDYICGGSDQLVAPRLTSGVLGITGNSNTLPCYGYKNGLQVKQFNSSYGTGPINFNVYIFALNNVNASAIYKSAMYIQAFAIYKVGLTTLQIAAVTDAMNLL